MSAQPMNTNIEITGVVLAGGQSSRMGEDKSLLPFGEHQMIEFSLQALEPYCKEILISTNTIEHQIFNYKTINDEYKNIGPIAGIQSALKNVKTDYFIVLPCDSPMVKPEFIKFLISQISENIDAVVPQYGSFLEPLFAIYHKRILCKIEKQIKEKDYKLIEFIKKIKAKIIEVQDRACFVNINTKADYQKYLF
jgi:molybdenum cofactor guanylyltransferase